MELVCQYAEDTGQLNQTEIRALLLSAATTPGITKSIGDASTPYHWQRAVEYLLESDDQVLDAVLHELADALSDRQNFSRWPHWEHTFLNLLGRLFKRYPTEGWDRLSVMLLHDKAALLRLSFACDALFDESRPRDEPQEPFISLIPEAYMIAWCQAHPDTGPALVARLTPVFDFRYGAIYSMAKALLVEFGNDPDAASTLYRRLAPSSWSGSLIPYLDRRLAAIRSLRDKNLPLHVQEWIRDVEPRLEATIEHERKRDEEDELRFSD